MTSKSKVPRMRTRSEASDYFKTHHRTRGRDLQMARTQTLSWNTDGTRLAVGCMDRKACVVNVDNCGRMFCDFIAAAHEGAIDQVSFQKDHSTVFATAGSDKSICTWDIRQPKKHIRLKTKVANMYVTWSPCNRYMIYGDKDDKVHVVDVRMHHQTLKTHEMKHESCELVYHPNGKYLFVAAGAGKVEVFSMPELELVTSIQAGSYMSTMNSIDVSKDGTKIVVGGNDAICSIWDLDDLICENTINRLDYPVRTVSLSGDGQLLALGSEDHHIEISWVEDGQKVCDIPVNGETFCVAWHPKQPLLAYVASSADPRDRDDVRLFGLP